jgi:hypothetical protein
MSIQTLNQTTHVGVDFVSGEGHQEQARRRAKYKAAEDSPVIRLERLAEIQVASMAILRGNPVAYRAYLKRNYEARRTEFVDGTWKPAARS